MSGISILIVDDDILLVEKLKKTMNWDKLDISAVFTANNIRQARSVIEEYPIHILLCDIDMPQGSGLELLEWIREQEKEIECVFLSSYANFAYAQMAVRLASKEFLLKPISNMELEQVLQKIVLVVKKQQKNTGFHMISERADWWKKLLLCQIPEEFWIKNILENKVYAENEKFCLILVRILETRKQKSQNKDYAILDFAINNIAYEYFQHKTGAYNPNEEERKTSLEAIVHISNLEWMFVLKAQIHMNSLVEGLGEALKKGNNREIAVYQGCPSALTELGKSRECLEDMAQNAVLNEKGILYEKNWKVTGNSYIQPPWKVWTQELLQLEDLNESKEKILDYLEGQKRQGGCRKDYMNQFVRELVQMMHHYLYQKELVYSQIFDDQEFMSYEKVAVESEIGIREFVQYIFEKLDYKSKVELNQQDVVLCLKNYIEEHLGEELSRTVLAQQVYLSVGYISKIFLKETGISLNDYIVERRMEKAKEYLIYSSMPISKIAIEVGYNNFSYFSKTFRDMTGCTPKEYRIGNVKINKKRDSN